MGGGRIVLYMYMYIRVLPMLFHHSGPQAFNRYTVATKMIVAIINLAQAMPIRSTLNFP